MNRELAKTLLLLVLLSMLGLMAYSVFRDRPSKAPYTPLPNPVPDNIVEGIGKG